MDRRDHPIWEVYSLQRTARLNFKYYSDLLARYKKKNTLIEFFLAVTVPGSAIAAWAFFKTDIGAQVWAVFIGISSLLAIAKPLLRYAEKIEKYGSLVIEYGALEHDLESIGVMFRKDNEYNEKMRWQFERVRDWIRNLKLRRPLERENKKLKEKYTIEVNKELPPESFYIPEE